MTITLYTGFSKRENSTKQPSTGTDVTVRLKDRTSIEKPTFELSGGVSSYEGVTAVKWGSRYYFVDDITSDLNGVTSIICSIDRGATFKSDITGSTQFVERCADISQMNVNLRDEACVATDKGYIVHFAPSGQLFPQQTFTKGVIAVRLSNNTPTSDSGGSSSIVYLDAQTDGTRPITALMQAFYSNGVITQLKNTIVSPLECIISCTYIPGITTDDMLTFERNGLAMYYAPDTQLVFGNHTYGTLPRVECVPGMGPFVYEKSIEVSLETMMKYPIFTWRNLPPYAKWSLYLPFFGTVPIPAEEYINIYDDTVPESNRGYFNMVIKMTLDMTSGELVYMRYKRHHAVGGSYTDIVAQEYRTTIGTPVAISSAQQNLVKFGSDVAVGVGGLVAAGVGIAASGGAAAVVGGLGAAVAGGASAVHDISTQIMSTAGSFNANGTQIASSQVNKIVLIQEGLEPQESPTDHATTLGYPCMKQIALSGLSGYVKCRNAHLEIAGTSDDKAFVNNLLNNGFFIE